MKVDLLIFSDKVGRGKTTVLKNWRVNQKGVGGVFSPKIEGKRYFEFIYSGILLEMESPKATLQIGKYSFDAENFAQAEKRIWADWINPDINTVIIDEIGPLEIYKVKGFHELLMRILNAESDHAKKLILVVRDYCLQDFFFNYPVSHAKIICESDLKSSILTRPVGIVLCGGTSRRMHTDKALIDYHGLPQWNHVYRMLKPFCERVYLSLNSRQADTWEIPNTRDVVIDEKGYLNHGPMTGLLSVLAEVGEKPLFLVACDYPLLKMENLFDLYKNRLPDKQIVCFKNNSFPEPLVSIFEKSAFQDLNCYFEAGKDSIVKFIRQSSSQMLNVSDSEFLRNANDPEELDRIKNQLNND